MDKILTPEQVKSLAKHLFRAIAGETITSQAARKVLCTFIEAHEALRGQDEAKSMEIKRLTEQLAESQADLRALAQRIQGVLDYYGNGRKQPFAYE